MNDDEFIAGLGLRTLEILHQCATEEISPSKRDAWKLLEKSCTQYYRRLPSSHRDSYVKRYTVDRAVEVGLLEKYTRTNNPFTRYPHEIYRLTRHGYTLVLEGPMALLRMRNDPAYRLPAIRNAILLWVYNESTQGNCPRSAEFPSANGPYGTQITETETEQQCRYLIENGLIEGARSTAVRHFLRVTAAGMKCLTDHDGDVGRYIRNQEGERRSMTSFDRSTHNHYYAPVFQDSAHGAQIAINSGTVNQTQTTTQQVTPGYEDVAREVTKTLAALPSLHLSEEDFDDARTTGGEVLTEVVSEAPDRGKIRRGLAALRGLLLPIATQAVAGAGEGAHELAKTAIEHLGSVQF